MQIRNNIYRYIATALLSGATVGAFCWWLIPATNGQPEEFKEKYVVRSLQLPLNLEFAGESVPLNQWEVREALDKELLVNTYWQSHTILLLKRSARYFPVIEPILKKNGIPEDFKYLPVIESDLSNLISPAQAVGFWQFLKTTGTAYGLEINEEVDMRYQVEASTEAACAYLRAAYQRFGSWSLAAASYNCGIAGLAKQIGRQSENNYYKLLLNDETARYVFRMLAMKLIIENPEGYGFKVPTEERYPKLQYNEIKIDTAVADLVQFAKSKGFTYKTLKLYNPWLRDVKLSNKQLKQYTIHIPQ